MVDLDYLRDHYAGLNDEELQRLARSELVPEARSVLEAEMVKRGLALMPASVATGKPHVPQSRNPYSPPGSVVSDAPAFITVPGLIRLFQRMIIASFVLVIVLFVSPYLPIPVAEEQLAFRSGAGAGALALDAAFPIYYLLQVFWILSAIGMYFFKWWGRLLFAGAYLLGAIQTLISGLEVNLPWESVVTMIATLLDGAILTLAFLPPLSTYFERDRGNSQHPG